MYKNLEEDLKCAEKHFERFLMNYDVVDAGHLIHTWWMYAQKYPDCEPMIRNSLETMIRRWIPQIQRYRQENPEMFMGGFGHVFRS